HSLPALTAVLMVLAPAWADDEVLSRADIVKQVKPTIALIDVAPTYGSGFCVHSSGLFVTSDHLITSLQDGGTVTVVLDAGQKTQQTLKAKVVRRDKDLDLALLRVEGKNKLPALALGKDEGLGELTELIAFGFP